MMKESADSPFEAIETAHRRRLRLHIPVLPAPEKLRFKAIERFGGKKGDLSRAVEEAVKIWVAKEK